MSKHDTITIKVAYDDAYGVPHDMEEQLRDNVTRSVEGGHLLNDAGLEAFIDEWSVDVAAEGDTHVD